MITILPMAPKIIINEIIRKEKLFPNNIIYPLLLYKDVQDLVAHSPEDIQSLLNYNHWQNSWVNGIYDYHHYHSNTHEVLIIYKGTCTVQVGGENGNLYKLGKGDVIILPAGVAHKKIKNSDDFKCIGAYPNGIDYDMNYGKKEEYPYVEENISAVELPKNDPIYGKNGPLFHYWQHRQVNSGSSHEKIL